jgi:phage terminase large subunit-like protein
MSQSVCDQIASLDQDKRNRWLQSLPQRLAVEISRNPWWFMGRPEQQEPEGDWLIWLILAGRGWGKTRTGAEWLASEILAQPLSPDGSPTEWAIIAETFGDTRVMCVEGPSGLLRVLEKRGLVNGEDFTYNKSSWQIRFKEGQKVHMFGADNPDAGRGYNLSGVWADEIAKWRYSYESWNEGIAPALRIGKQPRAVITTTPKPIKILRDWVSRNDGSVFVTRGSTFDNARNLSRAALTELKARYAGTRTGRQELYGELLEDTEGALFTRKLIDEARIETAPQMFRVATAIDPAVTSGDESDETGIITAGVNMVKGLTHFYIMGDDSLKQTPDAWGKKAIEAFRTHKADLIVAETNNGGDMIPHLILGIDPSVPVKKVHASKGKKARAEPISSLYEQGRVHHIGYFPALEDQMVTWTPDSGNSPDRLDALVWALTELNTGGRALLSLSAKANWCPKCELPMPKSYKNCNRCGTPMDKTGEGEETPL